MSLCSLLFGCPEFGGARRYVFLLPAIGGHWEGSGRATEVFVVGKVSRLFHYFCFVYLSPASIPFVVLSRACYRLPLAGLHT
jgi:hypothetical protein